MATSALRGESQEANWLHISMATAKQEMATVKLATTKA
jgi:hypothetical protein